MRKKKKSRMESPRVSAINKSSVFVDTKKVRRVFVVWGIGSTRLMVLIEWVFEFWVQAGRDGGKEKDIKWIKNKRLNIIGCISCLWALLEVAM